MATKTIRHLRDGQTLFHKVFAKLCVTKSSWQVWSDFVEMVAISISNSTEIRDKVKYEREQRYLTIINSYEKNEQMIFPELVSILIESLEREPEQDFLGEMFMALELGNHWKGQFFTPYNLCKMMSSINTHDAKDKILEKGWIGINDPACGAGATLIGVRNALALADIGSTQVFFVGQDIDRTAAMMCYIQLSLLGCAGYVVIADTLTNPITGPMLWPNIREGQDIWFMPLNFTEPEWVIRLNRTWRGDDVEGIKPATANTPTDAEQPPIEPLHEARAKPQQEPASAPESEQVFGYSGDQLTIF